MAGDKAAVARAQEVELDIMLKAKEEADFQKAESLRSSSSFSTPRASSATTSSKGTPRGSRAVPAPTKYVSAMAKAREERKRREAASEATSDGDTSSAPTSGSALSDGSVKPPNLPKFGEWEKHSANSGPCYTILFQHAAKEKKVGGPVPVRSGDASPPRTKDLYNAAPPPPDCKILKRKQFTFLCCF